MIKVARTTSPDPVQEKLRQNKASWNKDVSTFINDLINFKKTMNGAPSKFHQEKGSIKEPIPSDPATIIGSLANDFQNLAQKGNSIITEQINYSKTRKRPNITANIDYDLIVEGSSKVSRFFTRLLNPTIGTSEAARIRRYRMSLLDACVKVSKSLKKIQVEIVKSSPESIDNSNKLLHQTWNDWMLVSRGFYTYKNNMPKEVSDSGGEIKQESIQPSLDYKSKEISHNISLAKDAIQDFSSAVKQDASNLLPKEKFKTLLDIVGQFTMSPSEENAILLLKEYSNLIKILNELHKCNCVSLMQILKEIISNKKTASLNKVSQDFLKKWVGKTRHQLSLFDKTSAYRLDIYKMADEIKKTINSLMDSLEKEMNIDTLSSLINQINSGIVSLRGLMRALHNSE